MGAGFPVFFVPQTSVNGFVGCWGFGGLSMRQSRDSKGSSQEREQASMKLK